MHELEIDLLKVAALLIAFLYLIKQLKQVLRLLLVKSLDPLHKQVKPSLLWIPLLDGLSCLCCRLPLLFLNSSDTIFLRPNT